MLSIASAAEHILRIFLDSTNDKVGGVWGSRVVADPGFKFGRGTWRARGARAYNGGLGAEPPAGSRGRAPGRGIRGAKPPEAQSL